MKRYLFYFFQICVRNQLLWKNIIYEEGAEVEMSEDHGRSEGETPTTTRAVGLTTPRT